MRITHSKNAIVHLKNIFRNKLLVVASGSEVIVQINSLYQEAKVISRGRSQRGGTRVLKSPQSEN